jgi:hypothetical protein
LLYYFHVPDDVKAFAPLAALPVTRCYALIFRHFLLNLLY